MHVRFLFSCRVIRPLSSYDCDASNIVARENDVLEHCYECNIREKFLASFLTWRHWVADAIRNYKSKHFEDRSQPFRFVEYIVGSSHAKKNIEQLL